MQQQLNNGTETRNMKNGITTGYLSPASHRTKEGTFCAYCTIKVYTVTNLTN